MHIYLGNPMMVIFIITMTVRAFLVLCMSARCVHHHSRWRTRCCCLFTAKGSWDDRNIRVSNSFKEIYIHMYINVYTYLFVCVYIWYDCVDALDLIYTRAHARTLHGTIHRCVTAWSTIIYSITKTNKWQSKHVVKVTANEEEYAVFTSQ